MRKQGAPPSPEHRRIPLPLTCGRARHARITGDIGSERACLRSPEMTHAASAWERAGGLLGEIRRKEPKLRGKIPTLWNDLLIVLSARQVGAMVVTHDAQNFKLLRRYVRFDLQILS